jgi:hypothetical protein
MIKNSIINNYNKNKGCVWMVVLRSSRTKSGGLKYLSKRLPKINNEEDDEYEEEEEEVDVILF